MIKRGWMTRAVAFQKLVAAFAIGYAQSGFYVGEAGARNNRALRS